MKFRDLTPQQINELLYLLIEEGELTRAELSACRMFLGWQQGPEKKELEAQVLDSERRLNHTRSEAQRLQRLVVTLEERIKANERYINNLTERVGRISRQNLNLYERLRELSKSKKNLKK